MQAPGLFIPVAEETGLILPIGRWVLREACAQGKRWEAEGLKVATVAVNISALEFRQKNSSPTSDPRWRRAHSIRRLCSLKSPKAF